MDWLDTLPLELWNIKQFISTLWSPRDGAGYHLVLIDQFAYAACLATAVAGVGFGGVRGVVGTAQAVCCTAQVVFALHRLHFALHTLHFALRRVHFALQGTSTDCVLHAHSALTPIQNRTSIVQDTRSFCASSSFTNGYMAPCNPATKCQVNTEVLIEMLRPLWDQLWQWRCTGC